MDASLDYTSVYKQQYVDAILTKINGTVRSHFAPTERSTTYCTAFNLDHLLDRDINQLSGGELQRFACAAACSKQAKIYLFDEPSSYLDIKQRIQMAKNIRSLVDDDNNYVIVVEHDLSIMDYISDYICLFYGEESVYGVVTEPMNVRDGINVYLDGYIPTENIRFRESNISFDISDDQVIQFKNNNSFFVKTASASFSSSFKAVIFLFLKLIISLINLSW